MKKQELLTLLNEATYSLKVAPNIPFALDRLNTLKSILEGEYLVSDVQKELEATHPAYKKV